MSIDQRTTCFADTRTRFEVLCVVPPWLTIYGYSGVTKTPNETTIITLILYDPNKILHDTIFARSLTYTYMYDVNYVYPCVIQLKPVKRETPNCTQRRAQCKTIRLHGRIKSNGYRSDRSRIAISTNPILETNSPRTCARWFGQNVQRVFFSRSEGRRSFHTSPK